MTQINFKTEFLPSYQPFFRFKKRTLYSNLTLDAVRMHVLIFRDISTHKYKMINIIQYVKLFLRVEYEQISAQVRLRNKSPGFKMSFAACLLPSGYLVKIFISEEHLSHSTDFSVTTAASANTVN